MIEFLIQITVSLAIIGAVLAGLVALGNVLPTTFILGGITAANAFIGTLYSIFPLTTNAVFAALAALFLIEGYVGTYKLAKWIYQKIPGIS